MSYFYNSWNKQRISPASGVIETYCQQVGSKLLFMSLPVLAFNFYTITANISICHILDL